MMIAKKRVVTEGMPKPLSSRGQSLAVDLMIMLYSVALLCFPKVVLQTSPRAYPLVRESSFLLRSPALHRPCLTRAARFDEGRPNSYSPGFPASTGTVGVRVSVRLDEEEQQVRCHASSSRDPSWRCHSGIGVTHPQAPCRCMEIEMGTEIWRS